MENHLVAYTIHPNEKTRRQIGKNGFLGGKNGKKNSTPGERDAAYWHKTSGANKDGFPKLYGQERVRRLRQNLKEDGAATIQAIASAFLSKYEEKDDYAFSFNSKQSTESRAAKECSRLFPRVPETAGGRGEASPRF